MKRILKPADGEMIKLSPPLAGDITIAVDPQGAESAMTGGILTLPPRSAWPTMRQRDRETFLFVHKGQGRATIEGESMTVVPGMTIYVPRQAWHGLRNTGTGVLQVGWTSAPQGIEELFLELSRKGESADPAAVREIAERHGIEFKEGGETEVPAAPSPGQPRGRRRRGGRGRGRGTRRQGQPQGQKSQAAAPAQPAPPPRAAESPAAAQQPSGQKRRRRGGRGRGRGRGRSASSAQPSGTKQEGRGSPGRSAKPQQSSGRPRRGGGRPGRGYRRVKEVYMGGQWVQVTGEGPVISPGRERSGRRPRKDGDEPTTGPLSVPL